MSSAFSLLALPFLACLILTGIHAYLGFHVVERGVIFVDLSLAQIAALGATVAYLAGHDLHSSASYFYSLGFTLLGAAVFSAARFEKKRISQEAFIGIVYAVSAAASVLIADRSPEGAEHIKYILVGNLLAVTPGEVIRMAALYSVIGFLHWAWRKPIFAISASHEEARAAGFSVRFWDFIFYSTFGVVVTSSVAVAGVLLVFSYLIVPAVCANFLATRLRSMLLIGWLLATVASVAGLYGSYRFDLPTGAAIVCALGLALLLTIILVQFRKTPALPPQDDRPPIS